MDENTEAHEDEKSAGIAQPGSGGDIIPSQTGFRQVPRSFPEPVPYPGSFLEIRRRACLKIQPPLPHPHG